MSERAHTKGPWRLQPWYDPRPGLHTKPGRYSGIYEPIPGCDYGSRSLILGVGIKGDVEDYWLVMSDDNARLIAAAPTMAEAIEEAWSQAEMLQCAIFEGDPISELKVRVKDLIEVLRKASPSGDPSHG